MTNDERDALIARALEYAGGTHTLRDVLDEVERGGFQLWEGERSVVVTMISEHPRCKEAFAFAAAGDLSEIARMYPVIIDWARWQGCTKASFRGRPGWGRTFLKDEGWREAAVIYEKEL